MKRPLTALLLALVATGALSACNTMAGVGKDMQKLGDRIERKADR